MFCSALSFSTGATVSLRLEVVAGPLVLPAASITVTVYVTVSSLRDLRSRFSAQVPLLAGAGPVTAAGDPGLMAETDTVAPASALPATLMDGAVVALTYVGTFRAVAAAGAEMSLMPVAVLVALVLPAASVAVAENVTVPSFRLLRFMVMDHAPLPDAAAVPGTECPAPSLAVRLIVAPASAVPPTVTREALATLALGSGVVKAGAAGAWVSILTVWFCVVPALPTLSVAK